jgi:nitroimidazol reductase NimA-like FMN-containing flavoprotein (pyridoxamine 5'-phosphate oxidase superfamily)
MAGYGIRGDTKGLLPWKWANQRLERSHNYWLVTASTGGAPHVMPVWGVWSDGRFWFSTGTKSRKARNLAENPRCSVCTEKAHEAVIVQGTAQRVRPAAVPRKVSTAYRAKYKWKLDPKIGTIFAVRPRVAFGFWEAKFVESTTRWQFE